MSAENQLPSEMTEQETEAARQAEYLATRNRINAEVSNLIRTPFQRIIADYLACAPTPEDIRAFAAKFPDRYAAALAQIAPLAGFSKEISISSTNLHIVTNLPDSTLSARLLEAEQKLITMQQARMIVEQPGMSRDPAKLQPIPNASGTPQSRDHASPDDNAPDSTQSTTLSDSQHQDEPHGESHEPDNEPELHGESLTHSLSRLHPQSRSSLDDARTIDGETRLIDDV